MLENKQTIDITRAACEAYEMSDAEMGSLLSRMASASLAHLKKSAANDNATLCTEAALHMLEDILPEVSARLYARDGITLSRKSSALKDQPSSELRTAFIEAFQSDSFRSYLNLLHEDRLSRDEVREYDLITSPAVNGNIVVLGLDRLAPPSAQNIDRLAGVVKFAGSLRGVSCEDGKWHPDFAAYILGTEMQTFVSDQIDEMLEGDDDLDLLDIDSEENHSETQHPLQLSERAEVKEHEYEYEA